MTEANGTQKSASEASRAVNWEGGKRPPLLSPPFGLPLKPSKCTFISMRLLWKHEAG